MPDPGSVAARPAAGTAWLAVLGCLLGGGLLLLAAGRPWLRVTVAESLAGPAGQVTREAQRSASGGTLAPLLVSVGLAGVAAALLLPATRPRWRWLAGVALAAIGVLSAVTVLRLLSSTGADVLSAQRPEDAAGSVVAGSLVRTAWPWLGLLGAVLLLLAGLLVLLRGARLPTLGARFERRPAARRPVGAPGPRSDWDALERGEDPTR